MASKSRTKSETKSQADAVVSSHRNRPQLSGSDTEMREKRVAQVKEATKGITVAAVVQQLGSMSTSVQDALANVSRDLTERVRQLEAVGEALLIAKSELEEVHGKEVLASSIDDLVEERLTRQAETEKAIEDLTTAFNARKMDLDKQYLQVVNDKKDAWRREQVEFEYNRDQLRRKDQDEYNAKRKAIETADIETDRQIARDRVEREKALAAQETEYKKAIEALANKDVEIKKAADAASAIAASSVKKELTHEFALLKLGLENQINGLTGQLESKDSQIADLKAQVNRLETALAQAREAQLTLATKTVDGAHATKAFAEFSSLVGQNQANGPTARKS